MKHALPLLLLCVALGSGCATSAMKGTPFYSGEVAKREGPASDRVNLWPIAYWRDPALSVLWPIGEYSDDRLAIRPLLSLYRQDGPGSPYSEVNLLGGLASFDTRSHRHYIFPVGWGRHSGDFRYFHVFPLYWSWWETTGGNRLNALLPLWFYDRTRMPAGDETDLWLAGPLYRHQRSPDVSRDWLFPLWSRYRDSQGAAYDRYGLFLAGDLRDSNGHRHWIVPLYYRNESSDAFLSLPYAKQGSNHAIPLLLSGWGPDKGRILLGLGGWNKDESWLFPLYYRNPSSFLSLAYASGRDWSALPPLLSAWGDDWGLLAAGLAGWRDGAHWAAPLYYRDSDLFLSPLYASGDGWSALPPLLSAWGDDWGLLAGGLAGWGDGVHWIAPLYYRDADEGRFLSLLYAHDSDWSAIPPLLSAWGDNWGRVALGLAGWDRDGSGDLHRSWLAPLYYQDDDRVLSLLYASGDDWSAIPPLLSAWGDDWGRAVLGLAGWDRDNDGGLRRSWLAPLYYQDDDLFLSPLYASGDDWSAIPPLLSAWGDDWGYIALGLAGWNGGSGSHWVLPLYVRNPKEDAFLTPLFGHAKGDHGSTFSYWATPLVGTRSGRTTGSWFFPFWNTHFTRDTYDHNFLLLGGAKRTDADHSSRWFWPLFNDSSNAGVDRLRAEMDAPRAPDRPFTYTREWHNRNGISTGTSTYYREDSESESTSVLLGLGGSRHTVELNPSTWRLGREFPAPSADSAFARYLSPPRPDATNAVARYLATDENWLFPLWSGENRRGVMYDLADGSKTLDAGLETFSALWFLYDWKHESIPVESHDYVRRRVLWRLYHYERLNGDESTDIFPAITWDRRKDGYRKASFLWRLFRYEHDPAKGTSLDILFLPLRRPPTP